MCEITCMMSQIKFEANKTHQSFFNYLVSPLMLSGTSPSMTARFDSKICKIDQKRNLRIDNTF